MPESILFPAKVTITEDVEPSGLPVTHAELEVSEEVKALPLPTGPQGAPGPRGVPMPTWVRQDPPIANAAARPTGLTDADIGKWWHRLDDNGMDTWTDEGWKHSPNCVGVTGPAALPTAVTVSETLSDPKIRTSGIKITGPATDLDAKVTVPAGPQGVQGPNGVSTALRTRSDYDDTIGPVEKSMIAWKNRNSVVNLGGGKFRPQPFPNGYGPWTKFGSDFAAETGMISQDAFELVSIPIPALPFRWRPRVHAAVDIRTGDTDNKTFIGIRARLGVPDGKILGLGVNSFSYINTHDAAAGLVTICTPNYSNIAGFDSLGRYPQAVISPSSTDLTVAPYEATTIYLRIERSYTGTSSSKYFRHIRSTAYAQVLAMPVSL